jgi:aminopeptidase N
LNEIAKVSDFDIIKFQKEWLEDYHFQTEQANTLLKKSEFIRTLFEIQAQKNKPFKEKETYFTQIMKSNGFYALKKEIIYQITNVPFEEKAALIRLAMQTNEVEVRQSVAETIESIPASFQTEYESLLNDQSYDTKQIAFSNLYKSFPEKRENYLNIAQNWVGKNDKELRILFLTSYLDFHANDENNTTITNYLNELLDYTSLKYESSIRQNALEYVLLIAPNNLKALKNLVNGTTHHKWQFVKYSRDAIRALLKKEGFKELFTILLPDLSETEKFQLQRLLDEIK